MEFAVFAPVLALLFLGAVSLSLAAWTKMQVGNAARAGAVYAANHGYDAARIRTAAQNATALSGVTVTSIQATNSCIDPASGAISGAKDAKACPGTGSPPGSYVTVTTQLSYSLVLPIPNVTTVKTLNGLAVARIK